MILHQQVAVQFLGNSSLAGGSNAAQGSSRRNIVAGSLMFLLIMPFVAALPKENQVLLASLEIPTLCIAASVSQHLLTHPFGFAKSAFS